ncbi:MAG: DUF3108 domain-containing protein [Paludibacteraceae bacterium]|nr:DUF3108 domain-containing protein [Paludibacteraceae bacterium]MBR6043681.1 DUF3108 domain-containing protein [Paludibacteraceae bacterium]MCR5567780.1 DUF3108 domain-containing protein [Paludibacteraceae bacterium]
MRKFITLLAVAICSVVGASAQCSTENKVVPAEGETLKYGAYFNWGAIWVKGGEAIFKAEHVGNYLHFAVSAYSMPKWRWIYDLNTSIDAYMNRTNMKPVSYASNTFEDKRVKHEKISFLNGKLKYQTWNDSLQNMYTVEVDHPDCSYDLLNAVYAARNVDYSKFKIGEKIPFNVFFTEKMSSIMGEVLGKETIKVRSGKSYNCLKCKSNSVANSIFDPKHPVYVWITDDDRHIPVMVDCKIKLGSIKVYLEE